MAAGGDFGDSEFSGSVSGTAADFIDPDDRVRLGSDRERRLRVNRYRNQKQKGES